MKIFRVSILLTITCCTLGIMAFTNYSIIVRTAYAADNCDPTSTCTNIQTGIDNSQTNDCTNFSTCVNEANGNDNTQTNRCDTIEAESCSNRVAPFAGGGNDNNQITDCSRITNNDGLGCINLVDGSRNSQTIGCNEVNQGCFNGGDSDNIQVIKCNSVGQNAEFSTSCSNLGSLDNVQNIDCTNVLGTCENSGGSGNNQNIDCRDIESGCFNGAFGEFGSKNNQDINCLSVNGFGCFNFVSGDGDTQSALCYSVSEGCGNFALGNGNSQDLTCINRIKYTMIFCSLVLIHRRRFASTLGLVRMTVINTR